MKNILTLLLFAAAFAIITQRCSRAESDYEAQVAIINSTLPTGVELVPDGAVSTCGAWGTFRGKQPSLAVLDTMVNVYCVETVVRLNGNGKDSGGLPVEQERSWCEANGVEFYYFPVGDNPQKYAQEIAELMEWQVSFIHCKHGSDRTGAMIGYQLRQMGWRKKDIIRHNHWQNYLQQKGEAYKPYYETALNLER